ncbi:MAG: hypothetical protein FWF82_01935 [Oscillospiraceae bacterium]|nr:hypothetical protein [Oscillospiraceae bacterium]
MDINNVIQAISEYGFQIVFCAAVLTFAGIFLHVFRQQWVKDRESKREQLKKTADAELEKDRRKLDEELKVSEHQRKLTQDYHQRQINALNEIAESVKKDTRNIDKIHDNITVISTNMSNQTDSITAMWERIDSIKVICAGLDSKSDRILDYMKKE